jgi:energy-coupling factor transport system ATP-binding protein
VQEVRDAVGELLAQTGTTFVVVEHRVDVWLDLVDRIVVLQPGGGVLADGAPAAVFAEHGRSLAEEGVWVPDRPPPLPTRIPDPRRVADPLLSASGLAVARPGVAPAAAGIDTQIGQGACLAVVGPNGAGKSTLGLTMAGLLAPAAGRVAAGPQLLASGAAPRRRAGVARRLSPAEPWSWRSGDLLTRIGMVFQDPEHQFLTPTVRSELMHGPRRAGVGEREADARAEELMGRLRLSALAEANPFTLSGGEKRRLSVASALATRPNVLVLDEPTFGQDSRTWAEVVAIIADLLTDGVGALLVTHDDHVVGALADTVLTLPVTVPAGAPR